VLQILNRAGENLVHGPRGEFADVGNQRLVAATSPRIDTSAMIAGKIARNP
jgi:hypothetical protein